MCCLRPQPEQAHAGRHRLHRQGDTTAAGHPPPELVGKDRGKTAEEERRALHRRAGDRVQVRQVGALLGSECGRRGCRDSAGLRPGVPTLAHLSQSMGTTCSSFESTASSVAAHTWLLPLSLMMCHVCTRTASELLYFLMSAVKSLHGQGHADLVSMMGMAFQSLLAEIQWLAALLRSSQGGNSPHIKVRVCKQMRRQEILHDVVLRVFPAARASRLVE